MDMDLRSRSFMFFVYVSALHAITRGLLEGENITAAAGYYYNLTVFAVNDSVTWYTAREACAQEITDATFSIKGRDFCEYLARKLSQMNLLDDKLFWISRIKSKDDNVVYRGDTCNKDNALTDIVQQTEGMNDQTRCIVVNTSISSLSYGIDDCSNKHPYICWGSTTAESEVTSFSNVTASFDSNVVYSHIDTGKTYDKCKQGCGWWYPCLAIIYDFQTGDCKKIVVFGDNNLYDSGQLRISNATSFNILDVKIGKRVYIEMWQPSASRSQYPGSFYSCTSSPETSTESTSTPGTSTETACKCGCDHNTLTVNSTELQNWIKNITNMLTVNKKQLSSYTRRLISAEDSRPSSKAFGTFGAFIISCVLLFVCSGDVLKLFLYAKNVLFKQQRTLNK